MKKMEQIEMRETMDLEPIKIKLKECCLTCGTYYPDGIGVGSYCGLEQKREVSCLHMPVCYKYLGLEVDHGKDMGSN